MTIYGRHDAPPTPADPPGPAGLWMPWYDGLGNVCTPCPVVCADIPDTLRILADSNWMYIANYPQNNGSPFTYPGIPTMCQAANCRWVYIPNPFSYGYMIWFNEEYQSIGWEVYNQKTYQVIYAACHLFTGWPMVMPITYRLDGLPLVGQSTVDLLP